VEQQNKAPEGQARPRRSNTSYDLRPKVTVSLIEHQEQPDLLDAISFCCDPTDL
jgi:hypothetical protein